MTWPASIGLGNTSVRRLIYVSVNFHHCGWDRRVLSLKPRELPLRHPSPTVSFETVRAAYADTKRMMTLRLYSPNCENQSAPISRPTRESTRNRVAHLEMFYDQITQKWWLHIFPSSMLRYADHWRTHNRTNMSIRENPSKPRLLDLRHQLSAG